MNKCKTIIKRLKVLITCMLFFLLQNISYAQTISAYSFGSIGNMGDTLRKYSGSVNVQGNACVSIVNGIKTFQEIKYGAFTNYCEATVFKNELIALTASPNPISTYTFLKLKEAFLIDIDEPASIQIVDSHGRIIKEFSTTLSLLNYGFKIELNDPSLEGAYFATASSPTKQFKPLTLIKNK